jgi:galactose mutarotase-like enzyme
MVIVIRRFKAGCWSCDGEGSPKPAFFQSIGHLVLKIISDGPSYEYSEIKSLSGQDVPLIDISGGCRRPVEGTITFAGESGKLLKSWRVENLGAMDMYFQIGAHPAFYFPEFDAATKDRGFFVFDRKSDLEYIMPTEKGCVSPERHVLKLNKEGLMPIDIHTFDCDTYIFDNKQLKKITLLDKKKKPHISLEFNSPLVALWSPTKTHPDCPFVCIEPWYGRCDSVGYSGELKDREWIQKLEPKETFDVEYKIIIE